MPSTVTPVGSVDTWTVNDVISVASLIGSVFGKGGGDEAQRAELLNGLQRRLGLAAGGEAWADLRELQDPEAPVTLERRFPYGRVPTRRAGNAVIDDGSFTPVGGTTATAVTPPGPHASNALLVTARRSFNGHPLLVAGPQVGYFYPQLLMEVDLHGGGIDARGATFPGAAPYVLLGRGQDFAWSATSAGSDVIDQFVETLCGNDTTYHYRGRCVPMRTVRAGTLQAGGGERRRAITFNETVHGPVVGYATVGGERVAISQSRATRGREAINTLAFADLNANRATFGQELHPDDVPVRVHLQLVLRGRPRHRGVLGRHACPSATPRWTPGCPRWEPAATSGAAFCLPAAHPQQRGARSGVILNWNNKPAAGFAASDSNWSYGSIHRAQLLEDAIGERLGAREAGASSRSRRSWRR